MWKLTRRWTLFILQITQRGKKKEKKRKEEEITYFPWTASFLENKRTCLNEKNCWFKRSIDFVCSPFYPSIEHWFLFLLFIYLSLAAYLYWIFNAFVEYCIYHVKFDLYDMMAIEDTKKNKWKRKDHAW